MDNKRINVHYISAELNTIWDKTKEKDFPPMNRHMVYGMLVDKLIAELKRCYEKLDSQHKMISELIEANTVKGEILDELRVCDECGESWDYHPSGADCEAERQQASE